MLFGTLSRQHVSIIKVALDLFIIVYLVIQIISLKQYEDKTMSDYKAKLLSIEDFSIRIKNIPSEINTKEHP